MSHISPKRRKITAEEFDAGIPTADLAALEQALTDEEAARISADNTLQTNINTEASARASAVSAEASARSSADTTLQNNIDTEEAARIAQDSTLQNNIYTVDGRVDTEISARSSADTALQGNINAEETARINADNTLDGRIDTEITDRQDGDNALAGKIHSAKNILSTQKPGILIPLYVYPADVENNVTYNNLIALKKKYPDVPCYVILNPSSGPGVSTDGNYTYAIRRLHGAGCKVLGYISTDYTNISQSSVQGVVDTWLSLYPEIDGIFLDEMTWEENTTYANYYAGVTGYCHGKDLYPVIANPGCSIDNIYWESNSADNFVIHEGNTIPTESTLKGDYYGGNIDFAPWTKSCLVYGQTSFDQSVFDMIKKYVGLIYWTEDTAVNPWDSLSASIENLFRRLSSPNRTDTEGIVNLEYAESISAGDLVEIISSGKVVKVKTDMGSEVTFNSGGGTSHISAVALSDTKVYVAYRDEAHSNKGVAVVLTIAGNSISAGMEYVFTSTGTAEHISAVALSDTKVLVAYKDAAYLNLGYMIHTITESSISLGPTYTTTTDPDNVSAVALSDTKVLVIYGDNSSNATAKILTVSGTSISSGSTITFYYGGATSMSAAGLSDTRVLVAYQDHLGSDYGKARILTISGGITVGDEYTFNSAKTENIHATAIPDTNSVLVAYEDWGNLQYGTAVILTVFKESILAGSAVVFNEAITSYVMAILALSDTKALVAYRDESASHYGKALILNISGTDIATVGEPYTFSPGSTTPYSAVALSETKVLVAYEGGATTGVCKVLPICKIKVDGIAKESGNSGDMKDVYLPGDVVDLSTNYVLVPGTKYYPNNSGRLVSFPRQDDKDCALLSKRQKPVGVAITADLLNFFYND